ncbi:MAG: indole-3-glycerol phosphate synthase TrpC [Eubacteriales bacterium]
MILDEIVAKKKVRLEALKQVADLDQMKQGTDMYSRTFKQALTKSDDIAIIGEIKKASPSKGVIKPKFSVKDLAKSYDKADVQALSVLTEQDYFLGSPDYIKTAKENAHLPVLRKDFIFDPWQVYESHLLGADAILLIAAILDNQKLKQLYDLAMGLGLSVLTEVHDEEELMRVLDVDVDIIGINNRNLNDFSVDLATTETLAAKIPSGKVKVSESGIFDFANLSRMRDAGVDALLIGESLMRAKDIPKAVQELRGS